MINTITDTGLHMCTPHPWPYKSLETLPTASQEMYPVTHLQVPGWLHIGAVLAWRVL